MLQMWIATLSAELSLVRFIFSYKPGFSLRILVAGERCNVTGEYSERGSTSEKKNSHRLPNVSRRNLRSKQRIVRCPMPNEHLLKCIQDYSCSLSSGILFSWNITDWVIEYWQCLVKNVWSEFQKFFFKSYNKIFGFCTVHEVLVSTERGVAFLLHVPPLPQT